MAGNKACEKRGGIVPVATGSVDQATNSGSTGNPSTGGIVDRTMQQTGRYQGGAQLYGQQLDPHRVSHFTGRVNDTVAGNHLQARH